MFAEGILSNPGDLLLGDTSLILGMLLVFSGSPLSIDGRMPSLCVDAPFGYPKMIEKLVRTVTA
jgi:hypothetical protein